MSRSPAIFILSMLLSFPTVALQIGNVYPIAEEDLFEVMNRRLRNLQINETDLSKMSAFKGYHLPVNAKENLRRITPFYTLEFDLKGKAGETIYPKGYVFNPAAHSKLPNTLLIFSEEHVTFVKTKLKKTDLLLLTHGNIEQVKKEFDRPVFLLEPAMVERFDLRGAPTRVEQIGAQYEIQEWVPNND